MENEINQGKKKLNALNIVSSNIKHKGFGAGAIDLNQVSGIIIDGEEIYLDDATLHAKSKVEKGIKFSTNLDDVPNGRLCWLVWIAVDRGPDGQFYGGLAACEMRIDTEARRGWKILADHVNRMDKAMKRHILVENLNAKEKALLKGLLIQHNAEWYERSSEELKQALQE